MEEKEIKYVFFLEHSQPAVLLFSSVASIPALTLSK